MVDKQQAIVEFLAEQAPRRAASDGSISGVLELHHGIDATARRFGTRPTCS